MDEHDRLVVLERDVAHIDKTLTQVKANMKTGSAEVNKKFDDVNQKIDAVKDSLASAKVWALILYIGLAAGMLGTMWSGFLWLAHEQRENFTRLSGRLDTLMERKPEDAKQTSIEDRRP